MPSSTPARPTRAPSGTVGHRRAPSSSGTPWGTPSGPLRDVWHLSPAPAAAGRYRLPRIPPAPYANEPNLFSVFPSFVCCCWAVRGRSGKGRVRTGVNNAHGRHRRLGAAARAPGAAGVRSVRAPSLAAAWEGGVGDEDDRLHLCVGHQHPVAAERGRSRAAPPAMAVRLVALWSGPRT